MGSVEEWVRIVLLAMLKSRPLVLHVWSWTITTTTTSSASDLVRNENSDKEKSVELHLRPTDSEILGVVHNDRRFDKSSG